MWIVQDIAQPQLSLNRRLGFTARQALHSNVSSQRQRDISIGCDPSMYAQVWRSVNCYFDVVPWADHQSGSIGLPCLFLTLFRVIAGWGANNVRRFLWDVLA